MEIWKNENFEKWKFGKIETWRNGNLKNKHLEKQKFRKMKI